MVIMLVTIRKRWLNLKNKIVFKIGFISIIIFILLATYLWYLYFREYEGEVLAQNVRLELINKGRINYINAIPNDDEENIPTYYFRVKNSVDVPIEYEILIKDVSASEVGDGCSDATLFKREELKYELKRDNKVIASGKLSDLNNDVLDRTKMDGKMINDYSLRVWLNEEVLTTSLSKHYHYVINLKEIE